MPDSVNKAEPAIAAELVIIVVALGITVGALAITVVGLEITAVELGITVMALEIIAETGETAVLLLAPLTAVAAAPLLVPLTAVATEADHRAPVRVAGAALSAVVRAA